MNEDIPEVGKIGPGCRLVTGRDIESPLSFKDARDGLPTHRKFDQLRGDLKIQPVKVGFAAFYAEANRVKLVEECPKEWKPVSISGTDLRAQLGRGELPDPRIMRPETAKVLIEKYKGG